jgi:hypothetical protein
MKFEKVEYSKLSSKQKENYNFHQIAAILAGYGYTSLWLNDDWKGADFIALHNDGISDFKIQLKGGVTFAKKYLNKDLWICFSYGESWYIYPHDQIIEDLRERNILHGTKSWDEEGLYISTTLSKNMAGALEPYRVPE